MSKVKHFLRKFHIGGGGSSSGSSVDALTDHSHHHRRVTSDSPDTTPSQQHQLPNSSETTITTASTTSPVPDLESSENSSNANATPPNGADFGLLEEEFQVQLALAISVSDRESREDPETAQIKAAKQISLGCPPSQSLVDFISLQYWRYNVVNYDERVMDGFYDVHGLNSNMIPQEKMPMLVDLQSISVLDNVNYQVTLVNCTVDPELRKLVEKVKLMKTEYSSLELDPAMTLLVQKIAGMVVDRMGGPVNDTEEILRKWTSRSYELRMSLNSIVLPLGCLDIGLSRHRALLFKVLADQINLRCMLVKGSNYTGTDDGAVNLIKFSNGSEYMIDLMGAPGTLIPSEVPSSHQDIRGVISVEVAAYPDFGTGSGSALSNPGVHGVVKVSSEPSFASSKNPQMELVNYDFGKVSLRIDEEPLKTEPHKFASQYHVEDISNYVGNIARNPKLSSEGSPILKLPDVVGKAQLLEGETVVGSELLAGQKNIQRSVFSPGEFFSSSATGPGNIIVDSRADAMFSTTDISEQIKETTICEHSDSQTSQTEQVNNLLGGVAEWEIPWEDLLIGERIGIGSYGEVYRAEWNGTEVAVKKFVKQDISGDALAQFKCEIEIMLRLRHPNLVLFMGAVTRPPNLSILTEYLPRGSLFKLLHRSSSQIDEKRRLRMAIDVAKGMNYLHASHPIIVHRDLKTPNLLVDKNWVVKVCDFGMSRLKHHTFLSSKSTAGTAEWMAPEVLRNEPCNEKSDVYSFGVIVWELATLEVPWMGMNSMQVVGAVGFQGRHLKIPDRIDPMVADLINDCWNSNPVERPSFGQILARLKCLQHLVVSKAD